MQEPALKRYSWFYQKRNSEKIHVIFYLKCDNINTLGMG